MAAPIGAQLFGEILPYLEIEKDDETKIETVEQVEVPNIVGITIKEAIKLLKEVGLEINIENESEELDTENTIIKKQTPDAKIKVNKGSNVFVE